MDDEEEVIILFHSHSCCVNPQNFLSVNFPSLLIVQMFPLFHNDAQVRSHWHHLGGLADR